jgi:hypothetical protein
MLVFPCEVTNMPAPPLDENEPGPPRELSDFISPERFAEFNAETRRLRRELARQEEEVAAASAYLFRPATPTVRARCMTSEATTASNDP